MDPVTLAMMGMAGGSLLSGLGGLFGGQQQAGGAQNAAMISALMQQQGINAAQQMFGQAQQTLSPYTTSGSDALKMLMGYLQGTGAQTAGVGGGGANLLSTFAPTQAQLEQTPGYQFALSQGTQQAQNAAAAKGLGTSGNALASGINYATGLASTTFQQQLQNYLTQNQQAYNMLMGPSQMGATAAGQVAQAATGLGGQMIGAYTNLGNTLGAGTMGAANALAGGTQSLASGTGSAISNLLSAPYISQTMQNQQQANLSGIPSNLTYQSLGSSATGGSYYPVFQ
jgi:hypothetical protein